MKKIWKLLLLTAALAAGLCVTAGAESITASGFYNIGSASGVTVTPVSSEGASVQKTSAEVDSSLSGYETFYAGSDKLTVTMSGAVAGKQYFVLLTAGDGMPNRDSAICYVDQIAASSGKVTFDVFPRLTGVSGPLKLYITSDASSSYQEIPLRYAQTGTFELAPYLLGDVNLDGKVLVNDAQLVLNYIVGNIDLTATQKLAADVNRDNKILVNDAQKILNYIVGNIKSFD